MASGRRHILVIRFSALGDVAILAPVLRQKMAANPDVDVTVAAPAMLEPLFSNIPGVSYIGIDKHMGNLRIFKKLKACHPTVVADLHAVTRSFILDALFLLNLTPVYMMIKQRIKRRRLLSSKDIQLATSWQIYDYVLKKAGLAGSVEMLPYITPARKQNGSIRIGIAPFSTSRGKNWPIEKVETLVSMLIKCPSLEILFFGGSKYTGIFRTLTDKYPGTHTVSDPDFSSELDVIRSLDLMVSMDSANLHFASALGVPAVTIWGATHPFCGFAGWGQNPEWSVQADLPCRPCSIYGSKPCYKGTYECMEAITPQMVYDRIMAVVCADREYEFSGEVILNTSQRIDEFPR